MWTLVKSLKTLSVTEEFKILPYITKVCNHKKKAMSINLYRNRYRYSTYDKFCSNLKGKHSREYSCTWHPYRSDRSDTNRYWTTDRTITDTRGIFDKIQHIREACKRFIKVRNRYCLCWDILHTWKHIGHGHSFRMKVIRKPTGNSEGYLA